MKNITLAVLAIAVLAFIPSCAAPPTQTNASPAPAVSAEPAENVEDVITQLEKDWVAAIVSKDLTRLDGLLAADFNGTSPTGGTFPRDEAIEGLKTGSYAVESMSMDEVSVNVYGNTAVAFTSQQEKSRLDGKDNSGHYHFTNVWVKRNGRWQVVASHGSRLAGAK